MIRFLACLLLLASCTGTQKLSGDDGKISVNLILINDVYEIAPLAGGKEGGMARLATLKKQYLNKNPNTYLIMAGDFLSPSVYHTLRHEGQPIRGRQMIEAMNVAGVNLACFGNHEFDINENELQQRIDESDFQWVASNVFHRVGDSVRAFRKSDGTILPPFHIMTVKDADGTTARIGFLGICLPFNKADYVYYTDALLTSKDLYQQLHDSVDMIVAITHQLMEDDIRLAKELPELAVILGGHEHDQRFEKIGNVYIAKSMANAKSSFVITLNFDTRTQKLNVNPQLHILDEKVPPDSVTNKAVKKWTSIADSSFAPLGFHPDSIVLYEGPALDGRELLIRKQPTNLSQLVAASMQYVCPNADLTGFNAGSIRVDDVLHPPLTEYDILRTLPFGGGIREVDMKGTLLLKVLEQGLKNVGTGGFIVWNDRVEQQNNVWFIRKKPLDTSAIYRVALSDFLITGKEVNLEFLHPSNPDMIKVYDAPATNNPAFDIRKALIAYLKSK